MRAGRLHARFGTPVAALWSQSALAFALILSRKFDQLMDYAAAAMLISGSLAVATVVVLRRKQPDLPRPYRLRCCMWKCRNWWRLTCFLKLLTYNLYPDLQSMFGRLSNRHSRAE